MKILLERRKLQIKLADLSFPKPHKTLCPSCLLNEIEHGLQSAASGNNSIITMSKAKMFSNWYRTFISERFFNNNNDNSNNSNNYKNKLAPCKVHWFCVPWNAPASLFS